MHKINVLTFGSKNFSTSLEELKDYLSFKLTYSLNNLENELFKDYDVLLIHEDYSKNNLVKKELLEQSNKIKILMSTSSDPIPNFFNYFF